MRSALFSLVMLAACAPAQLPPAAAAPPGPGDGASQQACGAPRFQHLIGAPARGIDRASLPPGTRIIRPDSMVTQDFSAQRLNIIVGTDGGVSSLACF